jgi:type IV pilus assembly protein PilB
MTDPTNVFAMDDIKFMTGYNVEPVVASETAVVEAIQKYYPTAGKQVPAVQPSGPSALDAASRGLEELQESLAAPDDVEVLEELRATFTSSPTRRNCGSATASTASSTTS